MFIFLLITLLFLSMPGEFTTGKPYSMSCWIGGIRSRLVSGRRPR